MAQYTDLIPGIFPIEGVDIDDGDTYRSAKFNVGEKRVLGVTIKASQSLSVKVAWGRASDTAAAAGTASSASLPYATDAQTFASADSATESGTYKEFTIPPMAEQAQLVIANSSGSNVSDAFVDAALRVVSGASGAATTSASDLTSGTLAAARLPNGTPAYAGDAGGTANALTITVSGHTETAGAAFSFRATADNTSATTIAVNGGTARAICKRSQSGVVTALGGGELLNGGIYTVAWDATNSVYQLMGTTKLAAADIPSALNSTTVGGTKLAPEGAAYQIYPLVENSSSYLQILGGPNAGYANIRLYPASNATNPGDAKYYCGSATGAAHEFYDKDGTERGKISESGCVFGKIAMNLDSGGLWPSSNILSFTIFSDIVATGPKITLCPTSHATYPGAHQAFAPLITRTASTAIALCPVATGDVAIVDVQSTTVASCKVFVDASGTVTLYSPVGGTVDANIVNSSSPAAGEIGIYISAGVLYFKGGSSYAGKMASFSKIGKA